MSRGSYFFFEDLCYKHGMIPRPRSVTNALVASGQGCVVLGSDLGERRVARLTLYSVGARFPQSFVGR